MKKLMLALVMAAVIVPAAFGCCGRGYFGGYSYWPSYYGYSSCCY